MAQEHRILLCLPNNYAEKINAELKKAYPELKILGNAPSYNLLLKAFEMHNPTAIIVHIDVPDTHDAAFEAVSLNVAMDYIRKTNRKVKIILIHGNVKVTPQDEFNYRILDINVIKGNDVNSKDIGSILGLEVIDDFVQPIISTFSLKGGAGKSTTTSNVAILLKQTATPPVQFYNGYLQRQVNNLKVLIWDMDIQNGDMGITFGVPPTKNIYELMEKEEVIDITNIYKYIHTSQQFGVDVLAAPPRFDKVHPMTEENFLDILNILKQLYHIIIFDLPTEVVNRPLSFTSLKNSNYILNVFTPNKKGIKSALVTSKLFEFLTQNPIIKNIVNRVEDPRVDVSHIKKIIGADVHCLLPELHQVEILEDQGIFAIDSDKLYRENLLEMLKTTFPYFYMEEKSGKKDKKEEKSDAPENKNTKFSLFKKKEKGE